MQFIDRRDELGGLEALVDAAVQRGFLSEAVDARFAGFDAVVHPPRRAFLSHLVAEFERARSHGPVIFEEFPRLVAADSCLASTFQNWLDGEAARARLIVVVAGSSQRMMRGLVLHAGAPLYGRSRVLLELQALLPGYIREALGCSRRAQQGPAHPVPG